ncbi:MAG: thiamine diphosphokinase [Pseudomonadota bacterium]
MVRLSYTQPVILAGGGMLDERMLERAREAAAMAHPEGAGAVIAADGAADRLAALGQMPDAVIGDMDSLADPPAWAARGVEVIDLGEQDTTDFEKCLYSVAAPLYLAAGFTGRRHDHMLAVFHAMLRRAEQRVVLIAEEEAIALAPPGREIVLRPGIGGRVSIFPLRPVRCGPSSGLEWPVDGLVMAPGEAIGTSNRAVDATVRLRFYDPGALLLLEPSALVDLIAAVSSGAAS